MSIQESFLNRENFAPLDEEPAQFLVDSEEDIDSEELVEQEEIPENNQIFAEEIINPIDQNAVEEEPQNMVLPNSDEVKEVEKTMEIDSNETTIETPYMLPEEVEETEPEPIEPSYNYMLLDNIDDDLVPNAEEKNYDVVEHDDSFEEKQKVLANNCQDFKGSFLNNNDFSNSCGDWDGSLNY